MILFKHLTSLFYQVLCWKYFLSKALRVLVFELKTHLAMNFSVRKLGKPVSLCKFYLYLPKIIIKVTFIIVSVVLSQVKEMYFENVCEQEKQRSMAFKSLSSGARMPDLNPACAAYSNCVIMTKLPLCLTFFINVDNNNTLPHSCED